MLASIEPTAFAFACEVDACDSDVSDFLHRMALASITCCEAWCILLPGTAAGDPAAATCINLELIESRPHPSLSQRLLLPVTPCVAFYLLRRDSSLGTRSAI